MFHRSRKKEDNVSSGLEESRAFEEMPNRQAPGEGPGHLM